MKNVKNKLIFVLTSTILASGLTVGASAQSFTAGTSGSYGSWSTILSNAGNSSCPSGSASYPSGSTNSNSLSGSDLKSLLGDLYSYVPSSQVSDSTAGTNQSCPNTASQGTGLTTGKQTVSNVQSAAGSSSCPTTASKQTDSASASDNTAVSAAENTASEKAAAVKKTAQDTQTTTAAQTAAQTTAPETAAEEATDSSASTAASAPVSSSCSTASAQTAATADTASGSTLMQRINSFLKKCGLDLSSFGINLPGCENTTAAVPSSNGTSETAQQSNTASNSDTTTSADSNVNTNNQTTSSGSGQSDQSTASSNQNSTGSSAAQNADNLSFEEQVVALVNEQRAANGLQPLTLSTALSNAARAKSQDMHDNQYFAHESPTYGSPFEMLTSFGISYRTAGENIAMGYATPEAVMDGWMNSSGHRANILNANYTQIGVGYVADGSYWTQEFTG